MPVARGYKQTPEHVAKRTAPRPTPTMKRCPRCQEIKPAEAFGRRKKNPQWLRSRCKPCESAQTREWYAKNPEKLRAANRRGAFQRRGTTEAEFLALLDRQGGKCAICGTIKNGRRKRLSIDHCHVGGAIRGLLCDHCNIALGGFRDDPALLEKAVAYLRRAS